MKRIFTNARLLLPGEEQPREGSLMIDGVRIASATDMASHEGAEEIDCRGRLLAPGIVDLGVFAIDKPAFRFGGITRAALMPDQSPVLDLPAMIKQRAAEGKPDLWSHPIAVSKARIWQKSG